MEPLYSKYFIFAVKYFPFIFSISGSRIVIMVSFIFLQSREKVLLISGQKYEGSRK